MNASLVMNLFFMTVGLFEALAIQHQYDLALAAAKIVLKVARACVAHFRLFLRHLLN